MNKNRVFTIFFVVLVLFGFCVYLANPYGAKLFNKTFYYRLGLDLSFGTHLEYQGDLSKISPESRSDAMNSVREVIERRVNAFGVAEPFIAVSGSDRLIIDLPGVRDVDSAVAQIGQTPYLEFREQNPDFLPPDDGSDPDPYLAFAETKLSGAHLQRAEVTFSGGAQTGLNASEVSLIFNGEGAKLFAEITARNVGRQVAIFLDGEVISAPVVQTVIKDGRAVITGNFTLDAAKQLALRLNSGALPVPIELLTQASVGPTLGKESINKSLAAGIIGLFSVALFMTVFYGLPGLFAVLALLIYTAVSLAIFKLLNITLTLAGIAGFILSVGMAIDANILIFERTREELRRGRELLPAVEEGFDRAWISIRDSNISSLITTFVLGYFGASIIRGFAITLGLGILVSMFSAITVTRTFLRLAGMIKAFNTPRLFGVKRRD